MIKFAKIFNLPNNNQVLITIDYEPEEDLTNINVRSEINGVRATMALGYENEDEAKEVFKNFTEPQAISLRNQMQNILN